MFARQICFPTVCGTTGVRKACKNCSCGLAEELAAEGGKKEESTTKTSSCGNVSWYPCLGHSLNLNTLLHKC